MARVIPIGQPVNDAERKAIRFLRDRLPDDWTVFHNFELRIGPEVFEIDLALLAPHAVYLVDVKGTHGSIEVIGSKWYPEGRQPFHSPLAKLRNHAKVIAAMIRESNSGMTELRKVYVHATVLLTADDATLTDAQGIDGPDVTTLKSCLKYFRDPSRLPQHRTDNIQPFFKVIAKAIQGKARPRSQVAVYREWQVEEKLGGTDRYTEYRAKHTLLGERGGRARLRVYQADPYQDEDSRKSEFQKISNAYRAVAHMPAHANVLAVRDLFVDEDQSKVVLVTEDVQGAALRIHIQKPSRVLTFDQRFQVIRQVLSGLDHAHRYEVIHRNLTPDAIIVSKGTETRLTSFDFARVGKDRTSTIADQIVDELDPVYQAPECYRDPTQASVASDLYSAGLVFFELLTGELAFQNVDQMMEEDGKFPVNPSNLQPELPDGIDEWLQQFCEFDVEERYASAAVALREFDSLMLKPSGESVNSPQDNDDNQGDIPTTDLLKLPQDSVLAERFRIRTKLGDGGFGVAYRVFDTFGDVDRVIKLVTKDRRSVYERLKREYKTLVNLPPHPNVVDVVWADRLNDPERTPYIVFEYVDGLDVSDLIEEEAISPEDSLRLLKEAADGLKHLHSHGVFHQDIKPSNLLWTDSGVRIIDFNVAVSEADGFQGGGGTKRYLPPDATHGSSATPLDRADRDLYALGITFYECLTGHYPYAEANPILGSTPIDPRGFPGCGELSSELVAMVQKALSPTKEKRFASADQLLEAANRLSGRLRTRPSSSDSTGSEVGVASQLQLSPSSPNTNPFVRYLLTLYSQSELSNAGTRGLDAIGRATYVETFLDTRLKPAALDGELSLIIVSGNAGDGKTAFIQQLEAEAETRGAQLQRSANGAVFRLNDRTFRTVHDGSQDEGEESNEKVLERFFGPFAGTSEDEWPLEETRVIAINEGRLVDFICEHASDYPRLTPIIEDGLSGKDTSNSIAVVNLNQRSVVATGKDGVASILERLVTRLVSPEFWQACDSCDLKSKCYVLHNVRTFQDVVAGSKVLSRLKTAYTIAALRGRLHITMRDLRSAIAYTIANTRDCDEIHALYASGGEETQLQILDGFYFNSWMGGTSNTADRLLSLLHEVDVAEVSNPTLDQRLSFLSPRASEANRFEFGYRQAYDIEIMDALYRRRPREQSSTHRQHRIVGHRTYLGHLRRLHYFERRDAGWRSMLPFRTIQEFLRLMESGSDDRGAIVTKLLHAMNRGEGITESSFVGADLALRVRTVEKGTIRSYRLFPRERFSLSTGSDEHTPPQYLEYMPEALFLYYKSDVGSDAALRVNLDVYEMLMRLQDGYVPSVEEREGFYLSLTVFKNALAAAPYDSVVLTHDGSQFYRIDRDDEGVLHLNPAQQEAFG